jgi:spore maturation protein CgeB
VVYESPDQIPALLIQAAACDLVVKHSGVGVCDALLDAKILECRSPRTRVAFWDVDAPATLARLEENPADPFRALIPEYDLLFTYGGGSAVVGEYLRLGAANCYPIYNALDPETHYPVAADPSLRCDLAFVGHRLPDRERRVEDFFFKAARLAPDLQFILGGEGWAGKTLPQNVRWIGHVGTQDHNRVNCSARMVLNINRDSMAGVGFSPPTRIFEAAGACACLITDRWSGIEDFFAPGREILVAAGAEEIVSYLRSVPGDTARHIGNNMRQRALREHTYQLRAGQVDSVLQASPMSASSIEPNVVAKS